MTTKILPRCLLIPSAITLYLAISLPLSNPTPTIPRPNPSNDAVFSRWLLNQSYWGVLSVLDDCFFPFGNVVSCSDGGLGTPYFYLAKTRDVTGKYALKRPQASFTLSERELNEPTVGSSCDTIDPQSPVCAKITFSGNLIESNETSEAAKIAEAALFTNHPQLAGWPKSIGDFQLFKLEIGSIFLVNEFKPAKNVSVREYFKCQFNNMR